MRIHILFKAVVAVLLLVAFPSHGLAQEVVTLVYDDVCNYGDIRIVPSDEAKPLRVSSQRAGVVMIDKTNCSNMPDSLKVALKIASDVWSGYLAIGDSLKLQVYYDEIQGVDIRTAIYYRTLSALAPETYYPLALCRKLNNGFLKNSPQYDAVIHINKNVNWCVGMNSGGAMSMKNLSYSLLRAMAMALGFGSSVQYNKRGEIAFYFGNGISIFDKLVFAEDGRRLESFKGMSGQSLESFVQQNNGYLYASEKLDKYRLYAPQQFDEYKSLKYLLSQESLMCYSGEGVKDLVVDGTTLELLGAIGWDMFVDHDIKIVGRGIDDTGITSAYQSHTFYVESEGMPVTNHHWEYKLPLVSGGYETVATSQNAEFVIPAIADGDEDKYEHTIEGDIRGLISFEGTGNGKQVTSAYNLTLELKPRILRTNIVSIVPNQNNESYYDVTVDVYYEGSHDLYSTLEEEFGPFAFSLFSDTPYYTRLAYTNVDLWGCAWINISIRNDYGNDMAVLEIPSMMSLKNIATKIVRNDTCTSTEISVFTPTGILLGKVDGWDKLKDFSKGLLILQICDDNGISRTIKYMNK